MCLNYQKYIFLFFETQNAPKPVFDRLPYGRLRRCPDPLVGWEGDTPSSFLDAFGVSISAPMAPRFTPDFVPPIS